MYVLLAFSGYRVIIDQQHVWYDWPINVLVWVRYLQHFVLSDSTLHLCRNRGSCSCPTTQFLNSSIDTVPVRTITSYADLMPFCKALKLRLTLVFLCRQTGNTQLKLVKLLESTGSFENIHATARLPSYINLYTYLHTSPRSLRARGGNYDRRARSHRTFWCRDGPVYRGKSTGLARCA